MNSDNSERVRSLRAQADELRDAAALMKFRESRAALIILAESYDRLADKLDTPGKAHGPTRYETSATTIQRH